MTQAFPPSLLSKLLDVPVVFLDVETTGAMPRRGDRVTEIALACFEGGLPQSTYSQLVDPQRPIPPGITAFTGISNEMVAGQPCFADIAADVCRQLRGAVVVGHNVRFDLAFLAAELSRAGGCIGTVASSCHVMDTLRLARRQLGRGGNGLQRLAPRLGIVPTTAHRALADVLTTAAVFDRLLAPRGGWSLLLADALALQGGAVRIADAPPASPPATRRVETTADLEDALAAGTPIRLVYLDSKNNRSLRVVRPQRLLFMAGRPSLVAYCLTRQQFRKFHLARIVELTRID